MKIQTVKRAGKRTLKDMNRLLLQWSSADNYQMSPRHFKSLVENSYLIALFDKGAVIGTATLVPMHKISGLKGSIEHVLVDERYRGQGLGKKLITYAIRLAKKLQMKQLALTCEPKRVAANSLYKKMGFRVKDTNFYYLNLKHGKDDSRINV